MELGYIKFGMPVELRDTLTYVAPKTPKHMKSFKAFFNKDIPCVEIIFDKDNRLKDIKTFEEAKKLAGVRFVMVPIPNVAWMEAFDKQAPAPKSRVVETEKRPSIVKGKGKAAYKPKAKTA